MLHKLLQYLHYDNESLNNYFVCKDFQAASYPLTVVSSWPCISDLLTRTPRVTVPKSFAKIKTHSIYCFSSAKKPVTLLQKENKWVWHCLLLTNPSDASLPSRLAQAVWLTQHTNRKGRARRNWMSLEEA